MRYLKTYEENKVETHVVESRLGYSIVTVTLSHDMEILEYDGPHNEIDIIDIDEAEEEGVYNSYKKGYKIKGYLLEDYNNTMIIEDYNTRIIYYIPVDYNQWKFDKEVKKFNI